MALLPVIGQLVLVPSPGRLFKPLSNSKWSKKIPMEVNKVLKLILFFMQFFKNFVKLKHFVYIFLGRRLSSQGRRDMDRIAAQMVNVAKQ